MRINYNSLAGPLLATALMILPVSAGAASSAPTAQDKCPVCGMFVSKYPDWLAKITYKDGTVAYFDGPKDMVRYLANLKRYAPGKTPTAIESLQVKDYYSLKLIDGRTAYFVLGSDVYGPMGKELIPFANLAAAQEFMKDHKGKKILRFGQISNQTLNAYE
jgi:nitrous oxide reductase accessory protein NosL